MQGDTLVLCDEEMQQQAIRLSKSKLEELGMRYTSPAVETKVVRLLKYMLPQQA
jgi:hypothetical protein